MFRFVMLFQLCIRCFSLSTFRRVDIPSHLSVNIKSTISNHNHELLSNDPPASAQCSCKNEKECPLDGKCLVKNIVYKAEIASQNSKNAHRNDIKQL